MSFATSIPELFIGISSAIEKVPDFSFGDVLGANFINITLVIGLVAILNNGIKTESKISQKNLWFIFFIALLPILFSFDGVISRADGLILIMFFFFYLSRLLGEKEYFSKVLNGVKIDFEIFSKVFKEMFSFVLGILILIASSALLVFSGKNIASLINMDILVFSIIFVALGTTLPELTFGIRASLLKHNEMTLGNSIGSVAFNSSFVIGIVSLIKPIEIQKVSMFF
jgi:cation:H+ antiporter